MHINDDMVFINALQNVNTYVYIIESIRNLKKKNPRFQNWAYV